MTKEIYLGEISNVFCDFVTITNIQVAYELFKHYNIYLDKEIPDENGNKLCEDCINCSGCINCLGCRDCKSCWCICDLDGDINMFSLIDRIENLRNEPFNEQDKLDLEKCIKIIDEHIHFNNQCQV